MWQDVSNGITYLLSQSGQSLFDLFWFVILFEIPRYTLSFIAVAAISLPLARRKPAQPAADVGRVTMVIAGHNEEDSVERCVRSLQEQSRPPDEIIIVSDGSTDHMPEKLRQLQERGDIQEAHCTQLRAGKSAGVNLAVTRATGDILINVDLDCTFDRQAIKNMIAPFADPEVGAVAGNIVVRDPKRSLVTAFQGIEYLISISQGKQALDLADQMTCVSGAFGAFRRSALLAAGGLDAGGGEDLDVTLTIRKAGWRTLFAADSICYTDVPHTLSALVRQRFRWERDAIRLRYRKHRELVNPFGTRFSPLDLLHELDFTIFNVLAAIVFPFYIVWLFATYGDLAPMILLGAQAGMLVLDGLTFAVSAALAPKVNALVLVPYLPGYSLFNGLVMRFIRLGAYLQEWIFEASYDDTYVPQKVHRVRR